MNKKKRKKRLRTPDTGKR